MTLMVCCAPSCKTSHRFSAGIDAVAHGDDAGIGRDSDIDGSCHFRQSVAVRVGDWEVRIHSEENDGGCEDNHRTEVVGFCAS